MLPSHLTETFMHSSAIPPGRTVWELIPDQIDSNSALLFLDAELSLEQVKTVDLVQELVQSRQIPATPVFFVSHKNQSARVNDYLCNHQYDAFLTQDVLPTILTTHREIDPQNIILIGLSLSGLAAAHVALRHPSWFQAVIIQSGAFWWECEQLREKLPSAMSAHPRFWISVGDEETDGDVFHASAGLHQTVSQLDACRRVNEAMREFGYETEFRVYTGGHDPDCWREDLRLALPWGFTESSNQER